MKRHTKPRGATMQGGIIDKEMPIHVSNVALWCNKCGATRIGYRFDETGKKVRICRSAEATSDGRVRPRSARVCAQRYDTELKARSSRSSGSRTSCRCRGSRRSS